MFCSALCWWARWKIRAVQTGTTNQARQYLPQRKILGAQKRSQICTESQAADNFPIPLVAQSTLLAKQWGCIRWVETQRERNCWKADFVQQSPKALGTRHSEASSLILPCFMWVVGSENLQHTGHTALGSGWWNLLPPHHMWAVGEGFFSMMGHSMLIVQSRFFQHTACGESAGVKYQFSHDEHN